MRIPSGVTDQYIYLVAVDATDLKTRETGLSSFTVYRSRNGGSATAYTTPTVTEVSSSNMPGVYKLLLDEDMTIDSGDDSQEVCLHITASGMAPVTRVLELYRPKATAGETITVSSGITNAALQSIGNDASAEIADAVWDEPVAEHIGVGAAGAALLAAGSAGDPWSTGLPGAYGEGTAGYLIGNFPTDLGGDLSDIKAKTDQLSFSTTNRLDAQVHGMQADVITASAIAANAVGASELAADAATEIATAVWGATTRILTAGTNIVLAKGTGVTGFNDLDAAGVRSAVGLAGASLDTQLSAIVGYIDTEVAAIKAQTDKLPSDPADVSDIAAAFTVVDNALTALDNLIGTVKAKTDLIPSEPAATGDVPTAEENADALLDCAGAIETGLTPRETLRLLAALLGGKVSGSGTGREVFRNAVADSKDRVSVTVDGYGNRSAMVTDLT